MAQTFTRSAPWRHAQGLVKLSRKSSNTALLCGLLLVAGILAATASISLKDRTKAIASDTERAELLARVLEDQTTRTVESGLFILATMGDANALHAPGADLPRTESFLRETLAGAPFLRTVLVADATGLVIASSSPQESGISIDLRKLGPSPQKGKTTLGPWIAGRGVGSLRADAPQGATPAGLGFIPLMRKFVTPDGQDLLLIGLINPDALANQQQLAIGQVGFSSAIASYDGKILATSQETALHGAQASDLPVFRTYLPAREHGSYVGQGLGGGNQIVAFRLSRTQPLVVLVEEPRDAAINRWWTEVQGYIWLSCAATLVVLLLTLVAWRSLRSREAASHASRQAQIRIAHSERELAVLMRSVQEVIFRTNTAGRITFVNARLASLIGGSESAAIGRPLHELVEPSSRPAVEGLFANGEAGGVRNCQAMLRLENGRQLLFDVALVPLLDEGAVIGFAGSAVDVTERWIAQQSLQNELEFRGLMLEMNPLPISMTDMEGRLILVNRAWEEYQGRKRAEVIGLLLPDFLPTDESTVHAAADWQLQQRGGQVMFETRVLHGGRTWRDTRVTKAVVTDASGQPTGILCTLMDVSDFREAERLTREAHEAAEEASRSKAEFVANMSHELRTPLQSIMGFSELGMLRGKADARLAGMFEDIHRSGERMLSLVNDLLDVAKLESTVGTFHLERVDLRGVIHPVLRELEPLLAQRKLRLEVALGDLPLTAKVDPVRFQQVIRNVVANAIKFSPEASSITLLGRVDRRGQIRLAVRDHGPGIPQDELSAIFEAFKQSSKTKDGSGGTGLGLAICKKIVEALGGQIYAENVRQGGSVFHIILPARGATETIPAELE